jgi:flagellar hook-associated protein 1 FlgK
MYMPSFMGLHTAQRSLMAAQAGMTVVNHNIANANTAGYTKQRLELSQADPYQPPAPASGLIYQFGQGVQLDAVSRVRDGFLDNQFRYEQSKAGEFEFVNKTMTQVEDIVGEPSDQGLATSIQQLFDAVQDMANQPENLASRSAFLQQANDMMYLFQQQGRQLLQLHGNLVGVQGQQDTLNASQLGIAVADFNTKLQNLADLNNNISAVTASAGSPNDLLDRRAQLLEELSLSADIIVEDLPNNLVRVSLGGQELVRGKLLLNELTLTVSTEANAAGVPARLTTSNSAVDITDTITSGQLKGILDIAGNNPTVKSVMAVFDDINALFSSLTSSFNTLQASGRDLDGNLHNTGAASTIFSLKSSYPGTGPTLLHMELNPNLVDAPQRLALAANDSSVTGGFSGGGDNRNALAMAGLRYTAMAGINNQSFEQFHQTVVARLGTNARSYQDRATNQTNLLDELDARRSSVSGVNMDEEAIDLMRYQRMYEAASKVIKSLDEMYRTIINMV